MKIKIRSNLREIKSDSPLYANAISRKAEDKKALNKFFGGSKRIIKDISITIPTKVGSDGVTPKQFSSFALETLRKSFEKFLLEEATKDEEAMINQNIKVHSGAIGSSVALFINNILEVLTSLELNLDFKNNQIVTSRNKIKKDPNFPSKNMKLKFDSFVEFVTNSTNLKEELKNKIYDQLEFEDESEKNAIIQKISKLVPERLSLFNKIKRKYIDIITNPKIAGSNSFIVYSRVPLDVLRMSDFKNLQSCHSLGGSHDYCAIQEMESEGGGIAFLFFGELTDSIRQKIESGQDFLGDIERQETRGEGFIFPESRIRLRSYVIDGQYDLVVNTPEIYGLAFKEFFNVVQQEVKSSQTDVIDYVTQKYGSYLAKLAGTVTVLPLGGEYSDTPHAEMLADFFGIKTDVFFRLIKSSKMQVTADDEAKLEAIHKTNVLERKYLENIKDLLSVQIEDEYVENITNFEVNEDNISRIKYDIVLNYKFITHINSEGSFNQSVVESVLNLFKDKLDQDDMLDLFTDNLQQQIKQKIMKEFFNHEDFSRILARFNRLSVSGKVVSWSMSGNGVLDAFPEPEQNELFKQGIEQMKDFIDALEEPRNYKQFTKELFVWTRQQM